MRWALVNTLFQYNADTNAPEKDKTHQVIARWVVNHVHNTGILGDGLHTTQATSLILKQQTNALVGRSLPPQNH